jgi:hypothetical protein
MKVLIAFEESQAVTIEMRKLGHEAFSCDIQECSGGHPEWHIQGDAGDAIASQKWDLIGLHPPCTCLAVSGNRWYGNGMPMNEKRLTAAKAVEIIWTLATWQADKVYLENPVGVINKFCPYMPKPQYIQPWQFGHMEQKKTGLWLHNLPNLVETDNVYEEMMKLTKKERERIWYMSPGPERGKERSKTYTGIARAMAEQWGN